CVSQTGARLLISQEIDGQSQPTPAQYGHEALMAERTDQPVEGHGREMADRRTQLQTETTVCGQQGIAGHLGSHLAIAQDKVRQDGEYGSASRALQTPDGDSTQADPDVMGVACQALAAMTGRLVFQL